MRSLPTLALLALAVLGTACGSKSNDNNNANTNTSPGASGTASIETADTAPSMVSSTRPSIPEKPHATDLTAKMTEGAVVNPGSATQPPWVGKAPAIRKSEIGPVLTVVAVVPAGRNEAVTTRYGRVDARNTLAATLGVDVAAVGAAWAAANGKDDAAKAALNKAASLVFGAEGKGFDVASEWVCEGANKDNAVLNGQKFVLMQADAVDTVMAWRIAVLKRAGDATPTDPAAMDALRDDLDKRLNVWSQKTAGVDLAGVAFEPKKPAVAAVVGITGDPTEPDWVGISAGVYMGDSSAVLYTVGFAQRDSNMNKQQQLARSRGIINLSEQLSGSVKGLTREMVDGFKDYYASGAESSLEGYRACIDVPLIEYVEGATPIAFWVCRSPAAGGEMYTGAYFILLRLDANQVMTNYIDEVMARARAHAETTTKDIKGDIEVMLSKQSDHLTALVDKWLAKPPAAPKITIK
jgi:hypothetical protein